MKTGLSESQVYKWNWDQRKKFNQDNMEELDAEVARDEFGGYCCKRWSKKGFPILPEDDSFLADDNDNICELLGFNVNKMALDLIKEDSSHTAIKHETIKRVKPVTLSTPNKR